VLQEVLEQIRMKTYLKFTLVTFMMLMVFSISAQEVKQRQNKFEIALGVNAVDVFLNNAFGLGAKTEGSLIQDFFDTNDWNINSKAQNTYSDVGNKESALPPISLRAAYYFSDQIALGMHFSANYLDIIDLCYNAVGLPDMDFTNLEAFVRYSLLPRTKIEPYGQFAIGQSWANNTSALHAGIDLGATFWMSEHWGLGFTTGVKTPFGTDLSEYFQHTLELVYRFNSITTIDQEVVTDQNASYAYEEPKEVEKIPFLQRFPFLYKDINKVSRGIFFDYDMDDLKREVTDFILPEVINQMIKRPSLRILIEGHADEDGTERYNMGLSLRRAQAVANFIIASGISPNRIDIQAFGESMPAVPGDDEAVRAKNRRVVILEL
jgi:outer membrane protein OmpA-like peptidoglycan-associated protein